MAALSHLHATGFAKTCSAEFPGQERLKVIEIQMTPMPNFDDVIRSIDDRQKILLAAASRGRLSSVGGRRMIAIATPKTRTSDSRREDANVIDGRVLVQESVSVTLSGHPWTSRGSRPGC